MASVLHQPFVNTPHQKTKPGRYQTKNDDSCMPAQKARALPPNHHRMQECRLAYHLFPPLDCRDQEKNRGKNRRETPATTPTKLATTMAACPRAPPHSEREEATHSSRNGNPETSCRTTVASHEQRGRRGTYPVPAACLLSRVRPYTLPHARRCPPPPPPASDLLTLAVQSA